MTLWQHETATTDAMANWNLLAVVRAELPQKLVEARKLRKQGLAASAVFLAASVALIPALGVPVPQLPDWALPAVALAVGVPALGLAVAKLVLRDRLSIEFHEGRLYIQWDVPPSNLPPLPNGAIEVILNTSSSP